MADNHISTPAKQEEKDYEGDTSPFEFTREIGEDQETQEYYLKTSQFQDYQQTRNQLDMVIAETDPNDDNILGDTDEDLDALIEQEVQDAQNLLDKNENEIYDTSKSGFDLQKSGRFSAPQKISREEFQTMKRAQHLSEEKDQKYMAGTHQEQDIKTFNLEEESAIKEVNLKKEEESEKVQSEDTPSFKVKEETEEKEENENSEDSIHSVNLVHSKEETEELKDSDVEISSESEETQEEWKKESEAQERESKKTEEKASAIPEEEEEEVILGAKPQAHSKEGQKPKPKTEEEAEDKENSDREGEESSEVEEEEKEEREGEGEEEEEEGEEEGSYEESEKDTIAPCPNMILEEEEEEETKKAKKKATDAILQSLNQTKDLGVLFAQISKLTSENIGLKTQIRELDLKMQTQAHVQKIRQSANDSHKKEAELKVNNLTKTMNKEFKNKALQIEHHYKLLLQNIQTKFAKERDEKLFICFTVAFVFLIYCIGITAIKVFM